MVDSTKKNVTDQITTTNSLNQNSTTNSKIHAAVDNFRDLQQAIVDDINIPQVNAKEQRDAVDTLLQQLQTAINERNYSKTE
jgi:hypothetical protein